MKSESPVVNLGTMKPVKLSELIEAVEFDSPEHLTMVDLENGCTVTVEKWVLRAVEEGDEESMGTLPDWQKADVELARAIVDDPGNRFIAAPDKFEFHEYRHMERFIGTVRDAEIAEQLWRAICGKGAFRHFKDTAARLGLLDRWFAYRDEALKQFVLRWAQAHNVPVEDDVTRGPHA